MGEEIEHLLRGLIGMGEIFVARKLVFFPQRNWDITFGCGYRNLQILTETLRHYRNIAQRSKINRMPHFIEIQRDIELAWDDGFIRELNTTLLGSYEWLGCVEVTTFLGVCYCYSSLFHFPLRNFSRCHHFRIIKFIPKC